MNGSAKYLSVTFTLHFQVDIPQIPDEVITISDPVRAIRKGPCDGSVWNNSLLDGLCDEILITAHRSIQLVVGRLHPPGLVKADLGKWAGEERDGHVDGSNALRVSLWWDHSRRRTHG